MYLPVWVGFLYTCFDRLVSDLWTQTSRKAIPPFFSSSTVNWICGDMALAAASTWGSSPFLMMVKVSSTYRSQALILSPHIARSCPSSHSMKMSANTGESGEPMAAPLVSL